MIRRLFLVALPLAAACSAPAQAGDSAAVDAAVTALYAPYGAEAPDWDAVRALKNYSESTETLIAQWEKGLPEDEVTPLGDFDWLCECQDWDSSAFKLTIKPHGAPAAGKAEVSATIALGYGETRAERFLMVKEGGAWKVDDLFSGSFPKGLKAALTEEIANPQAE